MKDPLSGTKRRIHVLEVAGLPNKTLIPGRCGEDFLLVDSFLIPGISLAQE